MKTFSVVLLQAFAALFQQHNRKYLQNEKKALYYTLLWPYALFDLWTCLPITT